MFMGGAPPSFYCTFLLLGAIFPKSAVKFGKIRGLDFEPPYLSHINV